MASGVEGPWPCCAVAKKHWINEFTDQLATCTNVCIVIYTHIRMINIYIMYIMTSDICINILDMCENGNTSHMRPYIPLCPDLKSWIIKTRIPCALGICAPSPHPLPLCSHTLWRLWRGDTSKRCRRSGHLGTRNSASSASGKCVHDIRKMQSSSNQSPSKSTTLSKKDLSWIVAR